MNTRLNLFLKFDYHKTDKPTKIFFEGFWCILIFSNQAIANISIVSPICVCRVGLDEAVIRERSPRGPVENLGCLNKFGLITYKYFIISPKLGRIFYFPGTNFYFQPVPGTMTILWNHGIKPMEKKNKEKKTKKKKKKKKKNMYFIINVNNNNNI